MKKLQTGLTAVALATIFAATGAVPAGAAPLIPPKATVAIGQSAGQSDVIQIRDGRRWRYGWHNGYRGYPRYRSGYHYYDGWWFPAGAFVAGALIGGAIANSNSYYGGGYYPRYYEPAPVYYPPRSSYRAGYRDGYRDGYYARRPYNDITCTQRLESAGKC